MDVMVDMDIQVEFVQNVMLVIIQLVIKMHVQNVQLEVIHQLEQVVVLHVKQVIIKDHKDNHHVIHV